ncbi:hypothetical protein ZWY2020_041965 [Hordeum vulgare]|nr:hypothetical protein ZWY2020_041965 [Hordeum vulgare]
MASAAVLLLAAAVVVLLACLALADPPTREQSALLAILAATPQERKLGWSASTLACAWVGVTCDAANSTVIKLRLPGVGLVGPIPPSTIGRLTNLQDNAISGAIPPGVSRLAVLERLVLSHHNLSGPIPYTLGGLAALHALRLDSNRQSGKIPIIANPGLNTTGSTAPSMSAAVPADAVGNLQRHRCSQPSSSVPSPPGWAPAMASH